MDVHHLVKMANNIADFFAAEGDRSVAAKNIANHLKSFWEPRMRRDIFRHVDEKGGAGLKDIVLEALRTHRQELTPQSHP